MVVYAFGALVLAGAAAAVIALISGGTQSLNPDRVGGTLFREFSTTSTGISLLDWSCSIGGYDPSYTGLGCIPDADNGPPADAGIPYYEITAVGASCFKATIDHNAAVGGYLVDRAQWGVPDTIKACY